MPANEAPAREDDVESTVTDVPLPTSGDDEGEPLDVQEAALPDDELDDESDDVPAYEFAPAPARRYIPPAPPEFDDPPVPEQVASPAAEDVPAPEQDPLVEQPPVWEPAPAQTAAPQSAPAQAVAPAPAPEPEEEQDDLLTTVERLRMQVATLSLTLDVDGAPAARRERESLLSQLDDYLLPRLRRRDAPLLAVIGGSTGAGKSTLTNSLVRREVSRSGVLRPTTRSPVLVHHPYDSGAFMSQRILPRLNRITSEGAEPLQPIDPNAPRITGLRLVPHDGLTPGMALIDAPDIDSLVETNRDLAVQLLAAADLWIFVTTAARYADAMPWEMLKQAADRGVAVAVVLDRVPPEALADLRVHLATRLRDRGLGGAPLFTIAETQIIDGFLPERVVQPLQTWLRRVAGDERSRTVIADRTLKGIVGSVPARVQLLAAAATAQAQAWDQLRQDIDDVFTQARAQLLTSLTNGSLLSGDVLARWQEYLADGALVRRLDTSASLGERLSERVNERIGAAVRGDADAARPLDVSVTQAAAAAVQSAARSAMDETLGRWRRTPHGDALLEARGHQLYAADVTTQIELSMTEWRDALTDATDKLNELPTGEKAVDPAAAIDVLFVVSIDDTTDRSDGGSATVAAARRILSTFMGEDSVQSVTSAARADLVARAAVLLDSQRMRLERLLETGGMDGRRGEALLAAAQAVEGAR